MNKTSYIYEGHSAVTPSLVVDGASAAIEWYKNVFGAKENSRMENPDKTILHEGKGVLRTMYGELPFDYGDYLVIPRGTIYQIEFGSATNRLFIVESFSPIRFPKKYLSKYGQLLEHSPYCERDIRPPQNLPSYDEKGDFLIKAKKKGMPGRFSLYQDLTVRENLEFFATIFKTTVDENYDLIKDIYSQIEPFKDRKAGKLSGGMKQKLALSCALIHRPSVLFLDEPTTGVDAVSRKEFWEMLKRLKEQDITILVSTPYMLKLSELKPGDIVKVVNDIYAAKTRRCDYTKFVYF